jgi:alpha-L-fucosidase
MKNKLQFNRRDFLMAAGAAALPTVQVLRGQPTYEPSWDSLGKHKDPAWFGDAKFGIYFHWGPYSVPAFDNEWYSRNMYIEGERANQYHRLVYGPPSSFGYKDFIPMFRAEKFDAEEWADLFRKAGAKFAGPVTEHADGFSMWDSKLSRWNAAQMGPKRDVVGEMAKAIRNQHLKFITTFHHQWLWGWYPTLDKTLDTSDPKYAGLYGPPAPSSPFDYSKATPAAPQEFQDMWENKVKEVVDKYQPDLLWFDSRMNIIDERHRIDLFTFYYNKAEPWQREVGVAYKGKDLPSAVGIEDLERGRMSKIISEDWLNDDAIDWNSWSHVQKPAYKSVARLVTELVDIVSKNGNLLLDITPMASGVIPAEVKERLLEVGDWLRVNGEAIYETRPWKIFGEGPTKVQEGQFGEMKIPDFTAQDIRFTSRWKTLYAIALDWPQGTREFVIKSLNANDALISKREVAGIRMLGSEENLSWQQDAQGLKISLPLQKPGKYAYVFKILLG